MTEIEKHKLAVRTKFNELKIAIEEVRSFGLSPALCVRCFLYSEPIYREPTFDEYELDEQVPPHITKLINDLFKAIILDLAIERRLQDDVDFQKTIDDIEYQQFGAV